MSAAVSMMDSKAMLMVDIRFYIGTITKALLSDPSPLGLPKRLTGLWGSSGLACPQNHPSDSSSAG